MSRTIRPLSLLLLVGAPLCALAQDVPEIPAQDVPEIPAQDVPEIPAQDVPPPETTEDAAPEAAAPPADPGATGTPEPGTAGADDDEPDGTEDEQTFPAAHVPEITVSVDTGDGLSTGDIVPVTITAVVLDGDDVAVPEQGFGPFELFDQSYSDSLTSDRQRRRFRFELQLLALEPGELELPALRLRAVTASGEVETFRTDPQTITIGSHIANEPDAEPRPPTEPVQVFQEDYTLAWVLGVLGALLLTALLAFLFGRWWRKRPREAAPPPPPRPPWELAIERLGEIRREQKSLLADGREVELVDQISDVVREYLGRRYDFNGLESTSDEIVSRLRKVKFRGTSRDDIRDLLADSDLVKFAKAVPTAEQCEEMRLAAVKIVEATTPTGDGSRRPTPRPRAAERPGPKRPGEPPRARSGGGPGGDRVLDLVVHDLDEARREIGAAVGATMREASEQERPIRAILVRLSPELTASEATVKALVEIRDELASELDRVKASRAVQLGIELQHRRARDLEPGEPLQVTIVDDDGVRTQLREPKGLTATSAGQPPEVDQAVESPPPPGAASGPESSSAKTVPAPPRAAPKVARPTPRDRAPAATGIIQESHPAPAHPSATARLRVTARAFPEALERVRPVFFVKEPGLGEPLVRWITGLPRPIAYRYDADDGPVLFSSAALRGLRVSRSELHDRALANVRRTVPRDFAPTEEPAFLDHGAAALLVLSALVPQGERWLAYPERDGTLVVMREGAESTPEELRRLAADRGDGSLFERPVRIGPRGTEPADWPDDVADRRTDPGFVDPGPADEEAP